MPRGTRHDESGWLNEWNGERILRRDDGGRWRLEMGLWAHWRTRKLVGKRVRIVGIRHDFDVLAVTDIQAM